MKKHLLIGALLLGSFFATQAQETVSFEASEGFSLGNINGQNLWNSTPINGGEISNIENQIISDEMASEGTFSLKLQKEDAFGGQDDVIAGVFRTIDAGENNVVSVSADFYFGQQSQNDSDFAMILNTSDETSPFAARLQFRFNGDISFVNNGIDETTGNPALVFEATGVTWAINTWYNVEMSIDFAAETVTYSVDGTEVATGDLLASDVVQLAILHDNFAGFAYVDNVVMTGAVANVKEVEASNFAVYPNPANDVVNISANAGLNNVQVVDINGRTVKSVKFDGATQAQINISDLASGLYIMNIASDKGTTSQKIVKN